MTVDGQKKYLNTVSNVDYHASLDLSPTTDWSWDSENLTFTTMVNGTKYYIYGNSWWEGSGSYCYIESWYQNCSNYAMHLITKTEEKDPTSVVIEESEVTIAAGSSYKLHAHISPLGASSNLITWSVLDNNNVSVNSDGTVTVQDGAKTGTTATIKATCGSLSGDTCLINIINYGTSSSPLSIDEACELIDLMGTTAQTIYIKGIVTSNSGLIGERRWGSITFANDDDSNPSMLVANSVYSYDYSSIYGFENALYGKMAVISGVGQKSLGQYVITSSNLISVTNSNIIAKEISFDIDTLDIVAGNAYQLTTKLIPEYSISTYSFSSSNESVATVSETGLVTIASGAPSGSKAVITATTSEGIETSATFTVAQNIINGVKANVNKLDLIPGEQFQLELEYLPYGVSDTPGLVSYNNYGADIVSFSDMDENHAIVTVNYDAAIGTTTNVNVYVEANGGPYDIHVPLTVLTPIEILTSSLFDESSSSYTNRNIVGTVGNYSAYCVISYSSIVINSYYNSSSGMLGNYHGRYCDSITITFTANTYNGVIVDIYASNSAFTVSSASSSATKVGSYTYNGITSVTFNFQDNYQYFCLKTNSSSYGYAYISSIEVTWK